ncbi:sodium:solute symporter family protein [Halalkalicoccus salilacus]|uniref:sodium:solute symporter family protein n=1 Tax=Halalkalicoccus salilacus TaxID=3117459 RepID=UPI00300EA541
MNALAVQVGIIVGYLVLVLVIGVAAYRLTDRTAEDYYLASRTFGTVVLLFTTFATLLSAFTFFAGPNIAYREGPEWILVMGVMDGIIFAVLWYLVGYKQWLIGREHGYVTLGEMLGDRFGSSGLRALVAGISLFWLFPYVMLQQMGAGTALAALTDGAIPYWAGAGLITLFMIVYVVLAGMRGVAWTDTLQGAFMLGMVWLALAWVLLAVGGPAAATRELAATRPEFLALGGDYYTPAFVVTQAVSIAFGVAMFPQVNQRFFVARSRTVLKRTFALWPVLVLVLFVPAFMLGAWARGLGIEAQEGANVLPLLLAEYTPGWFAALVIAGAVAAMMSTSDSMLLSGSSYFTRDLYRPFVNPETSARREDLLGRIGVAVFAALAFLASLQRPGTLLEVGATAFGGFAQLALPVIVALYWTGTTRAGIAAGIAASQAFYLASVFLPALPMAYGGWGASLVGMAVGLVLTVGVSRFTAPANGEDTTIYFDLAD